MLPRTSHRNLTLLGSRNRYTLSKKHTTVRRAGTTQPPPPTRPGCQSEKRRGISVGRPALHLRLGSPHEQLHDHQTTGNSKVVCSTCERMEATTLHPALTPAFPTSPTAERDRTLLPIDREDCDSGVCVCQSIPALVDSAHWTASNSSMNCFAKVLATRRRIVLPVAMSLTPPSGLESAVKLASIKASSRP